MDEIPIFDYSVFLLIAANNGVKHDLQIMQNDALHFCKGITLLDMIYIPILHNSVKLLSLEQRRQIKVLKLMYIQAQ